MYYHWPVHNKSYWSKVNSVYLLSVRILSDLNLTTIDTERSYTSYGIFEQKQTYKPYILVGPTVTRRVQDPLAVLHLEKWLCMYLWGNPWNRVHSKTDDYVVCMYLRGNPWNRVHSKTDLCLLMQNPSNLSTHRF